MKITINNKIIVSAACLLAAFTFSENKSFGMEQEAKGTVNWTSGYIDAVGHGSAAATGSRGKDKIKARRAAEVTAQRALLEVIQGVRITSVSTVKDTMLQDDNIKSRIDGIIKGAQIVDEKTDWEGDAPIVTLKMRVCMNPGMKECNGASLSNAIDLDKKIEMPVIPQNTIVPPPVMQPEPQQQVQPQVVVIQPRQFSYDSTKPVTGVVFLLTAKNFERSLLPVIMTSTGSDLVTVYSAKTVKPSVIRSFGAVRYADNVDQALQSPQLAGNVLVITSTAVSNDNSILISSKDAATLKETLSHGNDYLSDAKVVISFN